MEKYGMIGQIGFLEDSVRNCHYSLRNNPEERCSQMWDEIEFQIRLIRVADKSNSM